MFFLIIFIVECKLIFFLFLSDLMFFKDDFEE